jgi:hypothetical protein
LKAAIVRAMHRSVQMFKDLHWLSFLTNFDDLATALVACKDEFDQATDGLILSEDKQHQMLALRGLLGRKVLEHSLEKRYRVDYGTADRYDCSFRCDVKSLGNKKKMYVNMSSVHLSGQRQ